MFTFAQFQRSCVRVLAVQRDLSLDKLLFLSRLVITPHNSDPAHDLYSQAIQRS